MLRAVESSCRRWSSYLWCFLWRVKVNKSCCLLNKQQGCWAFFDLSQSADHLESQAWLILICLSCISEEEEEFLVLPEQSPEALELMKERRDRLQRGEPVRAQLDRQPQAFRSSPNAQRFELPPEFYNLTADELKKEQQQRYRLQEKL